MWVDLVFRYYKRLKAGLPSPSLRQLHELLRDKHGYPLTESAMQLHLNKCVKGQYGR